MNRDYTNETFINKVVKRKFFKGLTMEKMQWKKS